MESRLGRLHGISLHRPWSDRDEKEKQAGIYFLYFCCDLLLYELDGNAIKRLLVSQVYGPA